MPPARPAPPPVVAGPIGPRRSVRPARAARITALAALALAGCQPAHPSTAAAPRPVIAGVAAPVGGPIVVVISAQAEWKAVVERLAASPDLDTPYGGWFTHTLGGRPLVFFHGGFGKVAAAGSAQYAIARWRPALLVNLGTCGGFAGRRAVGDVVLARETYVYDLYEQMGDAAETIERFHTRLDVRAWPARLAARVHVEPIVSGDRDLDPAAIEGLHARFGANVGDWESAAIAYVAAANRTPALILRGVSDVVDPRAGDPTYANDGAWERAAAQTMTALLALLAEAAPELAR